MTRQEHLQRAKQRALSILDSNTGPERFRDVFVTFGSDLTKHPENQGRYSSEHMLVGLLAATGEKEAELRKWIEEFT